MKYTVRDLERDLFRRNGKYTVMGFASAIIHIIYMLFYYKVNFMPMAVYNAVIVCLYVYFGVICSQGIKFRAFYAFMCVEIPLHALLSTFVFGWEYNFMYIILGMIPVAFYIIVMINDIPHKILLPSILSVFYTLLFLVTRTACKNIRPYLIGKEIDKYSSFFSQFNTLVTFIMLVGYSIIFSFEYNYIQTKLTLENKSLGNYASYDTLTGLLNRRSIDAHLDAMYKDHYLDEEGFSVIMCDIDHFKSVNDTYGHDAGDYILKEVSSVISEQVRDKDVLGRWGGEEFLIILNADKAAAVKLAERVRTALKKHVFNYKNITLNITMTFGVSAYHHGTDIPSLIRSADKKLYRGKENGRDQVVS